jgi:hypothetical protein
MHAHADVRQDAAEERQRQHGYDAGNQQTHGRRVHCEAQAQPCPAQRKGGVAENVPHPRGVGDQ